jgi:O-acetyl-ADP-ribose deacetylase (regulator of RNase III)
MENSWKLYYIMKIPLKLTSDDVVEYFRSICPGVHVELLWTATVFDKQSAELVFKACEPSKLHHLLRQRHEISGQQIRILPSMFNEVKAPVNKLWMDVMKQQAACDYVEFLKGNNQGVEVYQEGDEVYLQGHIDKVKAAMKSLQEAGMELLLSGPRDGSVGTQPTTGNIPTTSNSQDKGQKADGGRRERKLLNTGGESGASHQRTTTSSQQAKAQEPDNQQHPTGLPRSNSQSHDDNDDKSRSKQPSKPRQLKYPPPDSNCPTAMSASHDCNTQFSGDAGYQTVEQHAISLSIRKHLCLTKLYEDIFNKICKKCKRFVEYETGEDVNWVFTADNQAELDKIDKDFAHLISRVSSEKIFECTVHVPAECDVPDVEAILATNTSESTAVHLMSDKSVLVCGLDQRDVDSTARWLDNMLETTRLHRTSSVSQAKNVSAVVPPAATPRMSSSLLFCDVHNTDDRLDFKTRSGLSVHVYTGDMLHQGTEVIVNSANDQLAHGAGLARAILTAAGPQLDVEGREIIKAHGGRLHMGDVVHTSAGILRAPIRYVIHAVPPTLHQMNINKDEANRALVKVFYGSLEYANNELRACSISLPPFGAGIFAVPMNVILGAALKGLEQFDSYIQTQPSAATLKDIHFITNNPKLCKEMVSAFQSIIDATTGSGSSV